MNQDETMMVVLDKLDNLTNEFAGVRSDISGLKADVNGLKTDVSELKADVNTLKSDVGILKAGVSILKEDVGELKFSVRRLEVLHEETDSKIDHILEVLIPNSKEVVKLKDHNEVQDEQLQFHDRRICFLEKNAA